MAWSSPPAFVVSEIVTAARMNILSDDLSYLKGSAGTVAIDNELSTTLAAGGSFIVQGTSNGSYARIKTLAKTSGGADIDWRQIVNGNGLSEYGIFEVSTSRLTIAAGGNVGIGPTAPQGKLHGYDTISGFLHWKFDGVDGTARSVVPDGTGDVLYLLGGMGVTRTSGGATAATSFLGASAIAPGGSQVLYSSGADICALQVAANGAITVQRTGGALTYKVGLWLLWL